MNDDHLALRASEGDHDALTTLATRHQQQMRRWALLCVGRTELADEATQEALVRLVRGIRSYDPSYAFLPWLKTLVRNVALDLQRVEVRAARLDPVEAGGPGNPEAELDARRGIERARDAFATLSPRQREAYFACDVQGRRAVDVADAMQIDPATVRALLYQARTHIRRAVISSAPGVHDGL